MELCIYCVLISSLAILCFCEKWSDVHIHRAPGCLETLIDATDWTVSKFSVISDGVVEVDDDFFERYPNFSWSIYTARSGHLEGFVNVIVFVKNFRSLKDTLSAIYIREIDNRAKLVISVTEIFSSLDEIRKASSGVAAMMWKLGRTRHVYLVPCKKSILAMTHFPFARNCQVGEIEILDIWNGKYFEKGIELFPEMMLNIRSCVQNYSAVFDEHRQTIHVRKEFTESGEMILGGVGGKLINIVAEKMNMRLHLLDAEKFGDSIEQVIRRKSLFGFEASMPIEGLNYAFEQDIVYMQESIGLGYMTDGLEISWKNFVWPLSVEAWMYIGFTSVLFCGLIFLINLCHWSKITSDEFRIFESFGFFLGNARVLPRTNFGRYVIGMWIVYSLLINAAYNSGLISYLTTPVEGRLINTIDELLADGIEFGGGGWDREFFQDKSAPDGKKFYDNFKYWNLSEQKRRLFDRQGATIIMGSSIFLHDSDHFGNSSSRFHIHMLEEKALIFQLPILILRDSPYEIGLRRHTSQAIQSGFHDYWFKYYTRNRSSARIRTDAPIAISLQHIKGILYLYIVGIVFCCLVFLGELILRRCPLSRNSLNFILRKPS